VDSRIALPGFRMYVLFLLSTLLLALLACGVAPPRGETTPQGQPTETTISPTSAPTSAAASAKTPPTVPEYTPTARPSATQAVAPTPGPAPTFADLPNAISSYLDESNGNLQGLIAALESWHMLDKQEAVIGAFATQPDVIAADLDGDGEPEFIIAASNPRSEGLYKESALFIIGLQNGRYAAEYNSREGGETYGAIEILGILDVDQDGISDLAYGVESCGAHTCFIDINVLSRRGSQYVNLAENISAPYPDLIAFQDRDNDGLAEIIIHGNLIGSVGAGPQRPSTMVYHLQGSSYRLAAVEYDPSDLIYFKIVDANIALAQNRLETAIELYSQAMTDQSLTASGIMMNGMSEAEEKEALRSFACFRLTVAYVLNGEIAQATKNVGICRKLGGYFAPVTEVFWQAFSESEDAEMACSEVTTYTERTPELLDILNSFGYANPEFTPADVCKGTGRGLPEIESTPMVLGCPRCAD